MKRRILRVGLLLLLAVALVAGAVAMKSSNYRIDWLTLTTSSSGGASASANYKVDITVGQGIIGTTHSDNYRANLGYRYGLLRNFRRYLPAVMESKTH